MILGMVLTVLVLPAALAMVLLKWYLVMDTTIYYLLYTIDFIPFKQFLFMICLIVLMHNDHDITG